MISLFGGGSPSSVLDAISASLAIIEFTPAGEVISANKNFCRLLGYDCQDIIGKHHRMFIDPTIAASPEYAAFWVRLSQGTFDAGEYKRFGKDGREVWIQASYNPVFDRRKRVIKVVKIAADVTKEKQGTLEAAGKLAALSRVQAVIEFTPEGVILDANDNFCKALGYSRNEIQGQHHRMFLDPDHLNEAEYAHFWTQLRKGDFIAAEFKRIAKGRREIWIQASYNPILDADGKVTKVVKFATDVTDRVVSVSRIAHGLNRLAEGDLQVRIEAPLVAALETLRTDFNGSVSKLNEAMARVSTSTRAISGGAKEIGQASDDLARRTEQQAASLEETAAALSEVTKGVKGTADGTQKTTNVVEITRASAEASGKVVEAAVGAMSEIEKSSRQITTIISVIDEIAFQTNLLALNAGVEAARAGDAGRGFAVVASEVRALAQRSAEAAKEIKALIATSTTHVSNGVDLVRETGSALVQIIDQVAEISKLTRAIASSTSEQASALEQVSIAVNEMDQITQQNAAMVEEATAAANSLSHEVIDLEELVAAFNVVVQPELDCSRSRRDVPPMRRVANSAPKLVVSAGAKRSSEWVDF